MARVFSATQYKAPLVGPFNILVGSTKVVDVVESGIILSGIPTAPTAPPGTSTLQLATTAFVTNSVSNNNSVTISNYHTSLSGIESWYAAGKINSHTIDVLTITINTLYAMPFFLSKTQVLDRLAFNITGSALTKYARIGIYKTNGSSFYPTDLVYDSGQISTSPSGVKNASTVLSISLIPGLYWFALICNGTPAVSSLKKDEAFPVFGTTSLLSGDPGVGLSKAYTFAALPSSFPSGATAITIEIPAIFARFSS